MAIEYTFSRVEANCICKAGDPNEGKVCEVIVGMTAQDGNTSAYIDTTVTLTGDQVKAAEDLNLSAICNGAATDGNWKDILADQVSSMKDSPDPYTGVLTPPSVT